MQIIEKQQNKFSMVYIKPIFVHTKTIFVNKEKTF